jgi:hypothetical protein
MKKIALLLLPLLFCLSLAAFANSNADEPLTLLNQPQNNNQTTQQMAAPSQAEEFYDIHGPVPFSAKPPYLLIGGAILALLLILAAIYWFLKKRKKPAPPAIPPWEKALAELAEARSLFSSKKSLLYMERVSSILRSYIESRFAIRSTRQTTREFLEKVNRAASTTKTLLESRVELQACLEQADMAKFAHRIPDRENMEQMEIAVTAFIRKTEPMASAKGGKS